MEIRHNFVPLRLNNLLTVESFDIYDDRCNYIKSVIALAMATGTRTMSRLASSRTTMMLPHYNNRTAARGAADSQS